MLTLVVTHTPAHLLTSLTHTYKGLYLFLFFFVLLVILFGPSGYVSVCVRCLWMLLFHALFV